MRRQSTILINLTASAALLLGVACGHTHSVEDTATNANASSANATPPADKKAPAARDDRGRSTGAATGSAIVSGTGRDGAPPLSTSPAGLLKPHAIQSIQEKLVSKGSLSADHETGKLDEPTRKALREFQRSNNLPATGMPDDLTVRKLGLGTQDIFRASEETAQDHPLPK